MARELIVRLEVQDGGAVAKLAQAEGGIQRVERAAASAAPALSPVSKQLGGVAVAAEQAGTKLTSTGGMFSKATGIMGSALSGLATGAAAGLVLGLVDKLGGMASQFMETSSKIMDLSEKLHVSTDAVQRWQFAVDQTGGSMAALSTSAILLFKNLAGGKDSIKGAVEDLGLNFDTLRQMAPEKALEAVANALGSMQDPMEQARLGVLLMGRSFATNLPAMTEGLTKLGDEAQKAGAVMSGQAVKGGDALGDALGKLGDVGLTLLSTVLTPFLPVLSDLAEILVVVLGPFSKLLEFVLKPVGIALSIVGDYLKYVIGTFTDLAKPLEATSVGFGIMWAWLHDKLEPVLGPVIGLIESLGKMVWEMGKLWFAINEKIVESVIKMVTPVIMWLVDKLKPVFGPIITVIELLAKAYFAMSEKAVLAVKNLYEGVVLWLVNKFGFVVTSVKGAVDKVTGFFHDLYEKVVGHSYVPDMIEGIGAEFAKLDGKMVTPASAATATVTGLFSDMSKQTQGYITDFLHAASGGVEGLKKYASDFARDFVSTTLDILVPGLGQIFAAAWPLIEKSLGLIWSGVKHFFSALWDGIKGIGHAIGSLFSDTNPAKGLRAAFLAEQPKRPGTATSSGSDFFDDGPFSGFGPDGPMITPDLGFRNGTNGRFLDFGAGTPVTLHGFERVQTLKEAHDGGIDYEKLADAVARAVQSRPPTIYLDGKQVSRNQVRHTPRVLRLAGI